MENFNGFKKESCYRNETKAQRLLNDIRQLAMCENEKSHNYLRDALLAILNTAAEVESSTCLNDWKNFEILDTCFVARSQKCLPATIVSELIDLRKKIATGHFDYLSQEEKADATIQASSLAREISERFSIQETSSQEIEPLNKAMNDNP